jgi:methyl-accepting chemotaxis protein
MIVFPPPPPIAENDPIFNRWLHDMFQYISVNIGGIAKNAQDIAINAANIAANTSAITTHTSQIAANAANIATNTTNIATNTSAIATHSGQIAALSARSQVFYGTAAPAAGLGVNGDWYSDTAAKHIYVKSGGAWTLIV